MDTENQAGPNKETQQPGREVGQMMLFDYTAVAGLHKAEIHPSVHEKEFKHLLNNTRKHRLSQQYCQGLLHYFSLLCVIFPPQRLSSAFRIIFVEDLCAIILILL